ncbi:glycosyltransferase family 2 protein [Acinetobacter lwoffii]|uniref:glycosyltransferase family 2 protein n=1 Tax=Acinetobacter lwoffii TaxID=28090 RepID=UPI00209B0EA1|nr:glycosyltransferase family 2 protein [Acinetobacter lwoffii]MCO8061897.1 glycosyltransferase [Acinetobacter lwoffii]
MSYKISLIIPVYKTEKFIEKCLLSVCNQTLEKFEIIIIDDCSPDRSLDVVKKVLHQYPERAKHTKIISFNVNHGISYVRKYALDIANGEYIASLDSDDYLEPYALEELLNNARENSADIVFSDYYINESRIQRVIRQEPPSSIDETIKNLLEDRLHGSLCNKLFKKDILDKVCILEGVNMSEDLLISIQALFYCSKVSYLPIPCLHYVKCNPNSYTTVFSQNKIDQMVKGVIFIENFFKENNVLYKFNDSLNLRKVIIKSDAISYSEGNFLEKNTKLFEKSLSNMIYDKRINFYKNLLHISTKFNFLSLVNLIIKIRRNIKKVQGMCK